MSKLSEHPRSSAPERRQFIVKGAAALAGVAIAPGIILHTIAQARAPDEPVTSKVRWGMLIDTSRCADGCDKCVKACSGEHGLTGHDRPQTDPQWIRKVKLRDKQTDKITSLPVMCQHCEHPPCRDVCPTGASFKRADGIVLVDRHICIGCRYCMMACPYKARSLVHETVENQKPHTPRGKGTVEACNLCVHRVDAGRLPACVEACDGAMQFGDLNDPESDIAKRLAKESSMQLRADMKLNPGIRYQGI
ncbi:MAG: 4Fe-4S dicluster domain-containing protein [Gammaproteobacteria bacterium]|nr:4Fe-4S dicluster domain-containing protein [Gammaproteobacteria bacterium]